MARSLPVENLLPQNVGSIINYSSRVHTRTVESLTTDFKKAWFRSQQSIRVHTHFYVSRGACSQSLAGHHQVWFVSRHRSNGYRLKQALLGVIAGFVAKNQEKTEVSLVNYSIKLSGQKTEVFRRRYVYVNIFLPTFLTNSLIHWKKHHIAESCASNINTLYIFFIIINVNQVKINFINK